MAYEVNRLGEVRPSDLPREALPHAFRGWYSACRKIASGREHGVGSDLFNASFGRCTFRHGFRLYPNGLSARDWSCRDELCRYLDGTENGTTRATPGMLGRAYRRLRIGELRNRRLKESA